MEMLSLCHLGSLLNTVEGYHLAFEADPHYPVYLITHGTWGPIDGISQHLTEMDVGT